MKYNKGFVVPILLVVIALLVVGGGVYIYKTKEVGTSSVDTQIQQRNQFQVAKTGTQNVTLSQCENMTKHYNIYGQDETRDAKGSCYQNLAIANKDISLCEKISADSSFKGTCRYYVSVAKQDLSLCDTLPSGHSTTGKEACYTAVATSKHDYSTCDSIPLPSDPIGDPRNERASCIESIARIKGDCDMISGQGGKDYCYLYQSQSVRVSARDNRCDVYVESKPRALCEKYVNNKITLSEDCNRIVDTSLRQQCVSYNLNSVKVNYSN